jgi:hypothetical protein
MVGGNDELAFLPFLCGTDDLGGGSDHVSEFEHRQRRFRMRQHGGVGVQVFHVEQSARLELLVHDTGTVP